jgi:sialate O-acetylesterase
MRRRTGLAVIGRLGLALLALGLWAGVAAAEVRLPHVFGNNMVLQQGMPVPVWGWARAGEKVTVRFGDQTQTATADARGNWQVRLEALTADKKPRELTVVGENSVTFKDVLVGEVWVCSGQSNMEWTVNGVLNATAEKAAAEYPTIRQIKIPLTHAGQPQADVNGQWAVCSPATVGGFTAVGYFFAREVAQALDVPVGLVNTSWGGTRIEPWTNPAGFRAVPELMKMSPYQRIDEWDLTKEAGKAKYRAYLAQVKEWLPRAEAALDAGTNIPPLPTQPGPGSDHQQPTRIYNAMVHPLIPYAIRGALWYQGESNGGEGVEYFWKMQALIGGWRKVWGQGDFPFYYVQLANFQRSNPDNPAGGDGWARLREAQTMALRVPHTGMAVIIDIGAANDIHPKNKQDVGKRLALWALAKDYKRGGVYSGPLYKSHTVEGNKIRISFEHTGTGFMVGAKKGLEPTKEVPDGKLKGFAIAGKDNKWQWADAVIDGNTVVVSSAGVPEPVAVWYAFAMNPEGANLYNKEGLPAAPFRTDK